MAAGSMNRRKAVAVLVGLRRRERLLELPAVAGQPLDPALGVHPAQDPTQLGGSEVVATGQRVLGDAVWELTVEAVGGDAQVERIVVVELVGHRDPVQLVGAALDRGAAAVRGGDDAVYLQEAQRAADGRTGHPEVVRERALNQPGARLGLLLTDVVDDAGGHLPRERGRRHDRGAFRSGDLRWTSRLRGRSQGGPDR